MPSPLRRSQRLHGRPPVDIERLRLPQLITTSAAASSTTRPSLITISAGSSSTIQPSSSTNTSTEAEREESDLVPEHEGDESEEPIPESMDHILSLTTTSIPYDPRHPLFGIARRSVISSAVTPHYLGPFTYRCSACSAFHWKGEQTIGHSHSRRQTYLSCCHHGKVTLRLLQQPPQPLHGLYTSFNIEGKLFRHNIVQYNAALAFTSLGVMPDHAVNQQPGPPVFRVHGEVMHWSGRLLPEADTTPSYAQLYIFDAQQALELRMSRNASLDEGTMRALQTMVINHNAYYRLYLHAYEIINRAHIPDYSARLVTVPGCHGRQNDLPTAEEVAVILPDQASRIQPTSRDIILSLRSPQSQPPLQRISEGHASYAPTHYVLLFPRGEAGWHWDMTQLSTENGVTKTHKLTLCQYVSFRIHPRGEDVEFSTILRSCRLFHHYLVDMYACVDQARLLYHRLHQRQYRLSTASGMHDALHPTDDAINNDPSLEHRLASLGQRVLLPSSYIGGPRDMYQRYQDGMAVARHFKQIDLFITMTANPNWREIHEALLPGQAPHDRPDIVARVFHLKHRDFLHAITSDGIFGRCIAHVFTIEFQKRGLPHCHYLFTIASPHKLLTVDAVNSTIAASWPDPDIDPALFDLVKRHMVHGPCGVLNPQAPCMINGKCSKGYPKPFQLETRIDGHAYPRYRRPDDGRRFLVGRHMLDNRWIVPYSPFLLLRFRAHINVECTVNFGCLAYIMKYFKKLRDSGTLALKNEKDEIERYIQGRYFSAIESAWHVLQFEIHGQKPSVVHLPIHLPAEQPILFQPSQSQETLELQQQLENSPLMAFFRANADSGHLGEEARKYTYQEFPQHFVLKTPGGNRQKFWQLRQQGYSLGRIAFVKPSAGERFYLRLLLLHSKGPTSFSSLKEWPLNSGQVHATFHDACAARGLLEDDGEWRICLREAAEMQTGNQLRHLFVSLLLFSYLSSPVTLWDEFKTSLCMDLRYHLQHTRHFTPSDDEVLDYGLHLLHTSLQDAGHSLADFASMPQPTIQWDSSAMNPLIMEQLAFNADEERIQGETQLSMLNSEQRNMFDIFFPAIRSQQPSLFFLNGSGGTGKTFLYKTLCHVLRGERKIVLCVASSGVAALLLPKGRTAHSMFKIPIDIKENSTCSIPKQSLLAHLIRQSHAIIWDECILSHRWVLEAVDRTLKDIRDCDSIMGGIPTILGGDWFQCLPVIEEGHREDIVNACLQRSPLWESTHVVTLSQNMRVHDANSVRLPFIEWLRSVGDGTANDSEGKLQLPLSMVTTSSNSLLHHVYNAIFDGEHPLPPSYFASRSILAPHNIVIDDINDTLLDAFTGPLHIYNSADTILSDDGSPYPVASDVGIDNLHSLNPPNFPPAQLKLKIGCPLILLRNLNPSQGLCNGTRMILLHAAERVLEVLILTGDHANERAFIPRISLYPHALSLPFSFKRRQFPVRLSFAMTINKSEGQTLETIGVDLRSPVFAHGQLYVALSRAASSHSALVLLPPSSENGPPKTMNVVYHELLQ
ncbi:hypothetical protein Agabi119p4_9047 [Agaricus bisporus var. burnettii]|uniref:ATP-dependent DNA helicase n=1 Tax=Agaricus bisporus var. burnettii TaxID=192524 RepID=A0A8H7C6K0_AGABI|nr:hypothetical protein Agabi119p4_9047 [Agaricus bisporus var. burnettii]